VNSRLYDQQIGATTEGASVYRRACAEPIIVAVTSLTCPELNDDDDDDDESAVF